MKKKKSKSKTDAVREANALSRAINAEQRDKRLPKQMTLSVQEWVEREIKKLMGLKRWLVAREQDRRLSI